MLSDISLDQEKGGLQCPVRGLHSFFVRCIVFKIINLLVVNQGERVLDLYALMAGL